jgi:hypothetical protein
MIHCFINYTAYLRVTYQSFRAAIFSSVLSDLSELRNNAIRFWVHKFDARLRNTFIDKMFLRVIGPVYRSLITQAYDRQVGKHALLTKHNSVWCTGSASDHSDLRESFPFSTTETKICVLYAYFANILNNFSSIFAKINLRKFKKITKIFATNEN